jgi:transposase-like protein
MTLTPLAPDVEDGIEPFTEQDESCYGPIARNPRKIKAILAMLDAGHTQTDVAHTFGITQPTVSKLSREWTPVAELAERRAKSLAVDAVESLHRASRAAEDLGKHGPQVAILQAAGLLKAENSGPTVQVYVGGVDIKDVRIAVVNQAPLPDTFAPSESLSPSTFASETPLDGACK